MLFSDRDENPTETIQGTLADIEPAVARALSFEHGTFIAELPYQSDLFVQFVSGKGGVRFVFPLITPEQRQYEAAIHKAAQTVGVPIKRDGDDLQIEVDADARKVSRLVSEFLRRVYDVTAATPLKIQSF
jgi:hypothetical protein